MIVIGTVITKRMGAPVTVARRFNGQTRTCKGVYVCEATRDDYIAQSQIEGVLAEQEDDPTSVLHLAKHFYWVSVD